MMKNSSQLLTIKFSECGIGNVCLSYINEGIRACSNLKHIDLKHNVFESDAICNFFESLAHTYACKSLKLSGLKIEETEAT